MVNKCSIFGCNSNYRNQPYVKVVSLPTDEVERNRWIDAIPNERSSLLKLKKIYVCEHHFDCEWVSAKGGKRPSQPPSIFPGVQKSCLKQVNSVTRSFTSSAESRAQSEVLNNETQDKITNFSTFCDTVKKRFAKDHLISIDDNDIYISKTDQKGRCIIKFLHFQHVSSLCGFLHLKCIEKNEKEIPKSHFYKVGCLAKNSLITKWSQFDQILSCLTEYEFRDSDYLKHALEELDQMSCSDSPHFQFLYAQLQMLLTNLNGHRFDRNIYIFAAELYGISPAAYKMVRKSGSVVLPSIYMIKKLFSSTLNKENFQQLIEHLLPQQRLVNILFDEVKLTETLRYSGGKILGYAENNLKDNEVIATHAMVIEILCHFGGPRYILNIYPVAKLNSDQLKKIILETLAEVTDIGCTVISLVCDNCATNVAVYNKLGGIGKVFINAIDSFAFLVFDYVHVFKNIRNNWITEPNKELTFTKDGKTYIAKWKDIEALYFEDRKHQIRLTKISYTAVYPQPLQRQNVPFVSKIFNEKTVAALLTLKDKLDISEGTIILVKLITDWFHMMNVKDKYSHIRSRDECRQPWTVDCTSFKKLSETCDVISSCAWAGGRGRVQKLTKQTAQAFILTTRANIEAAEFLLTQQNFKYVLPSVFADEAIEKFFGQARQRSGGNFYIDVGDVKAAAAAKNLHTLLKYDITLEEHIAEPCSLNICTEDNQCEVTIADTEYFIKSNDNLKNKVIYIAGYLERKFRDKTTSLETEDENENENDLVNSEFLINLNRGGLTVPLLSTVHFVYSSYKQFNHYNLHCCSVHLTRIISCIDSPMAKIKGACFSMSNIIFKAFVLNHSDKEKQLGCLRRKEKLSSH